MFGGLAEIDGIKTFKPTGAFYLFADVSRLYDILEGSPTQSVFVTTCLKNCE